MGAHRACTSQSLFGSLASLTMQPEIDSSLVRLLQLAHDPCRRQMFSWILKKARRRTMVVVRAGSEKGQTEGRDRVAGASMALLQTGRLGGGVVAL